MALYHVDDLSSYSGDDVGVYNDVNNGFSKLLHHAFLS